MNKKQLEMFRKLLTEQLEALRNEAEKSVVEEAGPAVAMPDAVDLANHELNRDFEIHLRDRELRLIHKIEEALKRIEDGSYGKCVICGNEIGEKRLLARPMATLCIDCKTESETQERIRGE